MAGGGFRCYPGDRRSLAIRKEADDSTKLWHSGIQARLLSIIFSSVSLLESFNKLMSQQFWLRKNK
jgi:hypothetical protein